MFSMLVFCFHFYTTQQTCDVYKQIINNKPDINIEYAKDLSESIVAASEKHDINSTVYTAILMQESGYKLDAKNNQSEDFGISQINKNTIKLFRFNKKRLMKDLKYSVEAGAIVLSDIKKRYFNKEKHDYWSRYNTSKPKLRAIYKRKVVRHFPKKVNFYAKSGNK